MWDTDVYTKLLINWQTEVQQHLVVNFNSATLVRFLMRIFTIF